MSIMIRYDVMYHNHQRNQWLKIECGLAYLIETGEFYRANCSGTEF